MHKMLLTTMLTSSMFFTHVNATQKADVEVVQERGTYTLEGTTWKLSSFGLNRMAVPAGASIAFKDGQYSGHGGCNGVGGNYTLNDNMLSFAAGFSTMMACPELNLEHKYMKALEQVDSYKIEGDVLDLLSQGHSVLRFKAQ